MPRYDDFDEVTDFLNARDLRRSRRRKNHHLDAPAYRQVEPCYCLTLCARSHGKPFLLNSVAAEVVQAIRHPRDRGQCAVYAYCLMPDHLHIILRLVPAGATSAGEFDSVEDEPAQGLKAIVANFKRYTTTQVAWRHGLTGRLWQRDFYDHVGRKSDDIEAQCRYVLNNPVRAGLTEDWQDYPWCGILDEWRWEQS